MTHPGHRPALYELRVAGFLGQHWSQWFSGLTVIQEEGGTTTLTGAVDQAQLHGLLARIRDLGVTLISVTVVDHPDEPP